MKNPTVVIKTSLGTITAELYPDKAPETVKNFLQYVDDKFYDGTIFHRVISTFMIQGGGFDATLNKKSTRSPAGKRASPFSKSRSNRSTCSRPLLVRTAARGVIPPSAGNGWSGQSA